MRLFCFALDINECTLGTHNCEADFVCNNTPGSFRCNPRVKCRGGFIPDAFGSCIGEGDAVLKYEDSLGEWSKVH